MSYDEIKYMLFNNKCPVATVIKFLVFQYGADLHLSDNRGWTGLFYATYYNHVHVVKHLLRAGADPNLP